MFTFAGKHMTDDFGLRAKKIERTLGPEIEAITEKIPGRRGVSDQGIEEGALEIRVSFSYQALNVIDLRAHLRQVWAWLRNGGQLGELVFDDEPDLKYMARVVGLTELDEIIARSEGEITFLIPDPDALGKMDEQRIAGLGVGQVDSTAADFAKGTLSNVTTEVRAGQTDLILAKYGDPWLTTIRTDWDSGTYEEMMRAPDGKLTLQRGSGAHRTINTTAGWNDHSGRSNTSGSGNKLVLSNIPTFNVRDDMSAWKSQRWTDAYYLDTRKGSVTQQTGYMRVTKTGTGYDSTVMVMRNSPSGYQTSDRSNLFFIRTTSSQIRWQFVAKGVNLTLYLPNTGNQWKWFRVDYATNSATLYEVGSSTPIATATGANTAAPDRYGFIIGDAEKGTVDVSAVYYVPTSNLPAVTVDSLTGYSRYQIPLDNVGMPGTNSIVFNWEDRSAVEDGNPHVVSVQIRYIRDGNASVWYPVASGGSIPGLFLEAPFGPGDVLEVEVRLTTTDLGFSPEVSSLSVDIDSAYARSGSWQINYTDFRNVTRAIRSKITFEANTPAGTSVEVLATWRIGSQNYGPFKCTSGNPIPYLTNRLDISNATLTIEIRAETDSNSKSPEVSLLQLEMEPGYIADTDGERIAPGVEIGTVEVVGSSRIWWEDENPDPSKCSIEVFVSYDGEDWIPAVNSAEIPGAEPGEDVTGKTLYVRTVLRTSDPTLTPRLQVIGWEVSQETKTDLINEGTAPADAIFSGTFVSPAEYLQILHIQSGRRITLNHPFEAGDEVEIDCELGRVRINNSARDGQTAMSFNSRWIEVHPGYNSFEVTPSGVGEFFCLWRERWL